MLDFRVLGTLSLITGIGFLGVDLVKANELTYGNFSESMIAQSSSSIVGRWSDKIPNFFTMRDFNSNGTYAIYSTYNADSNGNPQGNLLRTGSGTYRIESGKIIATDVIGNQTFSFLCDINGNNMRCQNSVTGKVYTWTRM
jgi:hypothetical protein